MLFQLKSDRKPVFVWEKLKSVIEYTTLKSDQNSMNNSFDKDIWWLVVEVRMGIL